MPLQSNETVLSSTLDKLTIKVIVASGEVRSLLIGTVFLPLA